MNPYAYEAVTIDDTSGGITLTEATYDKAYHAYCTLEDGQIRFTVDGTAPTTTVGHILEVGGFVRNALRSSLETGK